MMSTEIASVAAGIPANYHSSHNGDGREIVVNPGRREERYDRDTCWIPAVDTSFDAWQLIREAMTGPAESENANPSYPGYVPAWHESDFHEYITGTISAAGYRALRAGRAVMRMIDFLTQFPAKSFVYPRDVEELADGGRELGAALVALDPAYCVRHDIGGESMADCVLSMVQTRNRRTLQVAEEIVRYAAAERARIARPGASSGGTAR